MGRHLRGTSSIAWGQAVQRCYCVMVTWCASVKRCRAIVSPARQPQTQDGSCSATDAKFGVYLACRRAGEADTGWLRTKT